MNLDLFSPPPIEVAPLPDSQRRHKQAMQLRDAKMRRWINAGKPVALEVARAHGQVTAATFRAEAVLRDGVLPPNYTDQRMLSYIPSIFAELVADGLLAKKRREDTSIVKEYDSESRNEHVVYILLDAPALNR